MIGLGFGSDGNLKELIELHRIPESEKKHILQKSIKIPTDKKNF